MITSFKQNWKVYSMEAICLGLFMVSASVFGTLLEYPLSGVHQFVSNDFSRLCLMGLAMGITATLINYSPMGKLSGAHMNPAVTLTFYRLGKVQRNDAIFYIVFQCIGGIAAVYVMTFLLGDAFKDSHVNYVVTAPGKMGVTSAFITEIIIAFGMMTMVLTTSNHPTLSKYTGKLAGFFVMSYVILSGPISGFSMNPARTLASAVPAMQFPSFWIYMTAPFIGMLAAAEVFVWRKRKVMCAKMVHAHSYLCIFNCGYCEHVDITSKSNNLSGMSSRQG
jgi:aquaporin Z